MIGCALNGNARVLDVPPVPTPVPAWFLDLAEAVGGTRLGTHGDKELVPRQRFAKAVERLAGTATDGFYERVSRWFLADPAIRPVSPF